MKKSTNPAAERTGYGWFERKFIVLGVCYPAIICRGLNRPRRGGVLNPHRIKTFSCLMHRYFVFRYLHLFMNVY
jgi:hypothetical protein